MEAQAALVGADGAVHLDAKALLDLDLALVVDPRHAEHDDALGLDDALEDLGIAVLGMARQDGLERLGHLLDGLVELDLALVLGDDIGHESLHVICHSVPSIRNRWIRKNGRATMRWKRRGDARRRGSAVVPTSQRARLEARGQGA